MNLRDLHIIYNKVPDFMGMTDGKIIGLYMIYEDSYVQFMIEVKYKNKDNTKIGLLAFDIENNRIDTLTKEQYIGVLEKINTVNRKNQYSQIANGLKEMKEIKNIVEFEEYFIVIKEESNQVRYVSDSNIKFNEINYKIKSNSSVLYCSPSIATSYTQIDINQIDKKKIESINCLTNVEVEILYKGKYYNDNGNIKKIQEQDGKIDVIIEPLEATLLDREIIGDVYFEGVTPEEMLKVMASVSKSFSVGQVDFSMRKKRKYKYITILNNFKMEEEVLQINDIVFSKSVYGIDINKLRPNSDKYIYVSIYITADTVAEAKDIAVKKIKDIVNVLQLIQKNSCFYKLYNEKTEINNWDINTVFVEYKLSDSFYIFNIFENNQKIYGSNKGEYIKNYGRIDKTSDIVVYNDEINNIIARATEKKDNLFNAIYWLNKGMEEINVDLNKCVIYLNIALEYCTNGEKGTSFFEQNEGAEEIFENINKYLDENYGKDKIAVGIKEKLRNTLCSASIKNRFEVMLSKLKIEYTETQFKNYNKIRNARNDIIHGRKKVKIQKHDIIDFYMFLSKVMFYKLKEE